jgi:hypothetical protein
MDNGIGLKIKKVGKDQHQCYEYNFEEKYNGVGGAESADQQKQQ